MCSYETAWSRRWSVALSLESTWACCSTSSLRMAPSQLSSILKGQYKERLQALGYLCQEISLGTQDVSRAMQESIRLSHFKLFVFEHILSLMSFVSSGFRRSSRWLMTWLSTSRTSGCTWPSSLLPCFMREGSPWENFSGESPQHLSHQTVEPFLSFIFELDASDLPAGKLQSL